MTTTTVQPSVEVTRALVEVVDPGLVAKVAELRRRLEEISPEVIALLEEARETLEHRCYPATDQVSCNPIGADCKVTDHIMAAIGADELDRLVMAVWRACKVDCCEASKGKHSDAA
jgi:hypothetical protein